MKIRVIHHLESWLSNNIKRHSSCLTGYKLGLVGYKVYSMQYESQRISVTCPADVYIELEVLKHEA